MQKTPCSECTGSTKPTFRRNPRPPEASEAAPPQGAGARSLPTLASLRLAPAPAPPPVRPAARGPVLATAPPTLPPLRPSLFLLIAWVEAPAFALFHTGECAVGDRGGGSGRWWRLPACSGETRARARPWDSSPGSLAPRRGTTCPPASLCAGVEGGAAGAERAGSPARAGNFAHGALEIGRAHV